MSKVRVDKWLWAVRIFKTRTLSTQVTKANRIRINGSAAKPSSPVSIGDTVTVNKNGFNFEFEVLKLLQKRVGAPIAVTAYNDITSEDELNKFEEWYIVKRARAETREKGAGRPTKKERRHLEDYKDLRLYSDTFFEEDEEEDPPVPD